MAVPDLLGSYDNHLHTAHMPIDGSEDLEIDFYTTNAKKLVTAHERYTEMVEASDRFWQEGLDDELREALIAKARKVVSTIYDNIEDWLPYSLIVNSTDEEIGGCGFYFNMLFVDLKDFVDRHQEAQALEVRAAAEKLARLVEEHGS